MQWVDDNILILIFGHVNISDIKHLFLVCKRWNNLGKRPPFWQPFVERKLKPYSVKGITAAKLLNFLETPQKAFQWVFNKKIVKNTYHRQLILLRNLEVTYDVHDHVQRLDLLEGDTITAFRFETKTDGVTIFSYIKTYFYPYSTLKWIEYKIQDITYRGEAFAFKTDHKHFSGIYPQGAGTWTFPDGSTFSGERVALGGLPHGKGLWNNTEEVEFDHGHRIFDERQKRRKIKWN